MNKSEIMKEAWRLYRKECESWGKEIACFAQCLADAWEKEKSHQAFLKKNSPIQKINYVTVQASEKFGSFLLPEQYA